eukprot:312664_1
MSLLILITSIICPLAAYFCGVLSGSIMVSIWCLSLSYHIFSFWNLYSDLTLNSSKLHNSYFKDRIVWITGASSGIGEALSFELASFGSKLILSARNEKKLNAIKQRIINNTEFNLQEKDILILPLDLSKTSIQQSVYKNDPNSAYQQILKHFKIQSIDILINNAGIAHDSLSDEIEIKDIYDVFNVNLISPAILTRTVLPNMYKNNFGHVINISSCTAYFNVGAMSIYAATKNGLSSLSRIYSTEMDFLNENVNCTLIVLGSINTGIDQRMRKSDGTVGKSESWLKWGIIEKGIKPSKCANLICNAASNKLKEAWISVNPQLAGMYCCAYFPFMYRYSKRFWMKIMFPPFIDAVAKRQ